jgi:hypothetical protein
MGILVAVTKEKFQAVGRALKNAGIVTGKTTATGYNHTTEWIVEQYNNFQERREMISELNDVCGDIAEEIGKFNSKMEVLDAAKALERHTILLRKVAKEMEKPS